jgi:hypothetical protein
VTKHNSEVQSKIDNLKLREAVAEAAAKGVRLLPEEAAIYVNKSKEYLAILRHKGLGPKFHRDGAAIYYLAEDLDAYSATCKLGRSVSDRVGRKPGAAWKGKPKEGGARKRAARR